MRAARRWRNAPVVLVYFYPALVTVIEIRCAMRMTAITAGGVEKVQHSGTSRSGETVAWAILAGSILLIFLGIFAAVLSARQRFLGPLGLNRTESFFVTQLAILLLLLAAVYASHRLRGYLRSKPDPDTEATVLEDGLIQFLWIGATLFLPYALAAILPGLSDVPHTELVMSIWFGFYIGMLGLRIATGYARSLRNGDHAAEATADQAGQSEDQ